MNRVQAELEENEKLMAEFSEQLTKLEDEAGEIMKACQEAEVCTFFFSTLYVFDTIYLRSIYSKLTASLFMNTCKPGKVMADCSFHVK